MTVRAIEVSAFGHDGPSQDRRRDESKRQQQRLQPGAFAGSFAVPGKIAERTGIMTTRHETYDKKLNSND